MCVTFWWFWWCMSSWVCIVNASHMLLGTMILGCVPKWLGMPRSSAGRPGMFFMSSPSGGSRMYFAGIFTWSSCTPIHCSMGANTGSGSLGDRFHEILPLSSVGTTIWLPAVDLALVIVPCAGVRMGSDCSSSLPTVLFLDLVVAISSTIELCSCQSSFCSIRSWRLYRDALNVRSTSSSPAPSSMIVSTFVTEKCARFINHTWADDGKTILESESTFRATSRSWAWLPPLFSSLDSSGTRDRGISTANCLSFLSRCKTSWTTPFAVGVPIRNELALVSWVSLPVAILFFGVLHLCTILAAAMVSWWQ